MRKFTSTIIIVALVAAIGTGGYFAWTRLSTTPATVSSEAQASSVPPSSEAQASSVPPSSEAQASSVPPSSVAQTSSVPPSSEAQTSSVPPSSVAQASSETPATSKASSVPSASSETSTNEPTLVVSASSVVQGDSLLLELKNVPNGVTPIATTDLSVTTFMPLGNGNWLAYTGVADSREPGKYDVTVSFKDFAQTVSVEVTKGKFNRQDLWINVTDPAISEANSDEAYKQYRAAIRPFYETADSEKYWDGKFLQPIQGRLSSEYGLMRYTNGSTTPSRHAGIDLAASTGTKIQSPAAGRVVFADYLLNTGNTIVIEHGGGLKSYYFHLSALDVAVDDSVKAGDLLGKVGSTGYSTGAHLHFEIRIGSQNLDPFKFFNGTGGCYMTEGTKLS